MKMKPIENYFKKRAEQKQASLDFNGAFVYYPKGILVKNVQQPLMVTHGYLVYGKTVKEAVELLQGKDYKKWLSKFKMLRPKKGRVSL